MKSLYFRKICAHLSFSLLSMLIAVLHMKIQPSHSPFQKKNPYKIEANMICFLLVVAISHRTSNIIIHAFVYHRVLGYCNKTNWIGSQIDEKSLNRKSNFIAVIHRSTKKKKNLETRKRVHIVYWAFTCRCFIYAYNKTSFIRKWGYIETTKNCIQLCRTNFPAANSF